MGKKQFVCKRKESNINSDEIRLRYNNSVTSNICETLDEVTAAFLYWMNSNGDLLSDKSIYFKKFYE
jgi:hypothetical protein